MTIKEIATLANVSTGTVDRVIHNRGKVNPEKKAIIEKIIEGSGFKPNVYARNLKLNRGTVIGYLTPSLDSEDGYWKIVYQGIQSAQNDLSDMSVSVKVYEYDRMEHGSFLSASNKMISDGVDAAVIIAKSVSEAKEFLSKNKDLVYVLVDSDIDGATPISTVSQNPYNGGCIGGKILSLLCKKEGTFLTFSFNDSHISRERINGFKRYCWERNYDVVDYNIDGIDDISSVIEKAFASYSINGVFVPFFAGAKVASDLEKNLHVIDIPIVSYDLVKSNREALLDGRISCILSQRPVFQGYAALWQIYRYIVLKQRIATKVEVQVDVLFKENLPTEFVGPENDSRLSQYCAPRESDFFWST